MSPLVWESPQQLSINNRNNPNVSVFCVRVFQDEQRYSDQHNPEENSIHVAANEKFLEKQGNSNRSQW